MILEHDQHAGRLGPLKEASYGLLDGLVGNKMPAGYKLYFADRLVRKAGGLLLFDGLGERTDLPAPVLDGTIPLRGIWLLATRRENDGRITYSFRRNIRFGRIGWYKEQMFHAHYTI